MKTGNLTSLILLLLLSWITIAHSKCSDDTHLYVEEFEAGYARMCDFEGNFEVQQCHLATGRCFCVDRITGVEIPGTSAPVGVNPPDCESAQQSATEAITTAATTTITTTTTTTAAATTVTTATTSASESQATASTTEDFQFNFDENDICYKQNKKTFDYWNYKMKSYEAQVQRWQESMEEYENYLKSLETDQT